MKRETGDVYAAKTMHGHGKLKDFMKSEMEVMNQMCHPKLVRLRDAFETNDHLTLVTDMYPFEPDFVIETETHLHLLIPTISLRKIHYF